MTIIKPSVEIIEEKDVCKRIEIAARTCYKSGDRATDDSAKKMVAALIKRGHESPLEHSVITVIIHKLEVMTELTSILAQYEACEAVPHFVKVASHDDRPYIFSANVRAWRSLCRFRATPLLTYICYCHFMDLFEDVFNNPCIVDLFDKYGNDVDILTNDGVNDRTNIITARFTCDRGVSHELVRHRLLSFCVDGDTEVYSMGSSENHWTIRQLYDWQNDPKRSGRLKLMQIRSCDETTGELVKNKIVKVYKTGVKPCYEIKTKHGRSLVCTADHRILTKNGYVPLHDIHIGDYVMSNGLPLLENREWIYNYYITQNHTRAETAAKIGCCEATLYKAFQKYGIKKPLSDRPNRHPGHGVKGMFSAEAIDKLHNIHLGENNCKYKENVHDLTADGARNRSRRLIQKQSCCVCGSTSRLEVHHIDHDPYHYTEDNLEVLCSKCHKQRHGILSKLAVFSDPVISIVFVGNREVYDVEMEAPFHNFVANGIVVHNCQESTRYVNYKDGLTFIEPWWWPEQETSDTQLIRTCCQTAEDTYKSLIVSGSSPQKARAVLPNMLKTEVVATGTVEYWKKYVLPLRLSKAAHPDMRRIMTLFCEQLGWDPAEFGG